MKPFVKWAGGKNKLLPIIKQHLPVTIKKYAEPFIGGGAVFLHIVTNFNIEELYISDTNEILISSYENIKNNVNDLICLLDNLEQEFNITSKKEEYYKNIKDRYNNSDSSIQKCADFIFLNHTCFNGLYRVNSKNLFNVPFGKYNKVKIYEKNNLFNIQKALQKTKIICSSYTECYDFVDNDTFVYFDPPYRPISKTSNFTKYTKNGFNDNNQIELCDFYKKLNKKNAKIMLSNSFSEDGFFQEIYKDFNIIEVKAKRMINSKIDKRGDVKEILIINY